MTRKPWFYLRKKQYEGGASDKDKKITSVVCGMPLQYIIFEHKTTYLLLEATSHISPLMILLIEFISLLS